MIQAGTIASLRHTKEALVRENVSVFLRVQTQTEVISRLDSSVATAVDNLSVFTDSKSARAMLTCERISLLKVINRVKAI